MPVFIYPSGVDWPTAPRARLRSLGELVAAAETTTQVLRALERYEERDRAIEALEDDIRIGRSLATHDLRELLRPLAREALV